VFTALNAAFCEATTTTATTTTTTATTATQTTDAKTNNSSSSATIGAAVLSMPGPVENDAIKDIANFEGGAAHRRLSIAELSACCPALFPLHRARMINDLVAGCKGLLALDATRKLGTCFAQLWTNNSTTKTDDDEKCLSLQPHHYMVVNPGTGLGNALLFYYKDARGVSQHIVVPMEGGHTAVSFVGENLEFFTWVSAKRFPGTTFSVEWDDMCSGRGLEFCHQWIMHKQEAKQQQQEEEKGKQQQQQQQQHLSAPQVAALAKAFMEDKKTEKDGSGFAALKLWFDIVLRFAQSTTATLQAKGLILGGSNVMNNAFFLLNADNVAALRAVFLDHSTEASMQWMSRVTVLRQTVEWNSNLEGTLTLGQQVLDAATTTTATTIQ
jgi:glucokinase